MIPVRRTDQVVVVEIAQREFGDEHRRHAVQTRALLRGNSFERQRRIEPGAGITIAAPWVVAARLPITMPKQW